MRRPVIPLTVLGGGALGLVAGAGYGLVAGGMGEAFAFGGFGFGVGLVLGSIVGAAWLVLVTLLTWGKPDGPAVDYDDEPPAGRHGR